ncbi:MAG: ParA family protein [Thermoproteus sp.]
MRASLVISALSYKGGVGKSTILASLAVAVQRASNLRAIVVDVTPDATASRLLAPQCYVKGGSLTYVTGTELLEICTTTDGARVDVIPPGSAYEGKGELRINPLRLQSMVDALRGEYNIIFVDLPGTSEIHSDAVRAAIRFSDAYLIVLTPQVVHLLDQFRRLVSTSGRPYIIALNRYIEGAPGKAEVQGFGRTRWGNAAFIIYDEPEVELAVLQGKVPSEVKGTKFYNVIDSMAAFILRLFRSS